MILRRMKVVLSLLVIFSLITAISVFLNVYGEDESGIKLIIDGEIVKDTVNPVEEGSTVYVQARTICEYLGADFEYSDMEGKIGIFSSDKSIELLVDAPYADIDSGNVIELKNAPIKINEDVMLPLELIATSFGAETKYDKSKKEIHINYFSKLSGKLIMGGASAFMNMSQRAIDKLKKLSPDFDARVLGGGSSAGMNACINGEFDIANITRNLTAEEMNDYPDLSSHRVAKEGIAVIVNPANPVNNLTQASICKMFEGVYMNWKVVNGPEWPVFVNVHEAGSGTLNTFFEIAIMRNDEFGYLAKTAIPNASNGLVKQAVASEPIAVGFVTFPFIDKSVKAVSIENIKPDKQSVLDKTWPLVNRMNVVVKGKVEGLRARYINFLRSKMGRQIIEDEGFINLDNYHLDELQN